MNDFLKVEPTIENRWRAIILFGRNTASFKFALGEALLSAGTGPSDLIRLDDLALPYAKAICRHLEGAPKQITTSTGKFLNACSSWNSGTIDDEALRNATVSLGFNNVIDAFHNIGGDLGVRFFIDERRENKGIRLTNEFRRLAADHRIDDLGQEVEARWRLVETAWELGVAVPLVSYDPDRVDFGADLRGRRVTVTSARDALNGYQKGRCFYCFGSISIVPGSADFADVDHFIPHALQAWLPININGVWNLVLACCDCNRGVMGKSDRVPSARLLARLHARNEFFIGSHHPLRETLIAQTGPTERDRASFLRRVHTVAMELRVADWYPVPKAEAAF
jgi:HNH endonuclease